MRTHPLTLCTGALLALLLVPAPRAQSAADLRAAVPSPAVLARGGAGVALASRETALFYNPAHLGKARRAYFTLAGVSLGTRADFQDVIAFYQDDLSNAGDRSEAELRRMEREAYDLLGQPFTLRPTVHLPAFGFKAGSVGVGFGAFVQGTARAQVHETGSEYPDVAVFGQVDGVATLALGAPVPGTPVTLGVSGRYVQRHVTAYTEALDRFEEPPVLRGTTVAFDVGALYETPLAGLTAGLAIYDLFGGRMDYERGDFYGVLDRRNGSAAAEARAREALDGAGGPSLRLGAAYELPRAYTGGLGRAAVLADWTSASTLTEGSAGLVGRLHLGAEGAMGPLRLRGGLGQGRPTVGAGLDLLILQVDYALHAPREGALGDGTAPAYAHLLQLRLGR